jgi:hypothetical protein
VDGHTKDCAWTLHVARLAGDSVQTPTLVGSRMRTWCDCGVADRTTDGPPDSDETLGLREGSPRESR